MNLRRQSIGSIETCRSCGGQLLAMLHKLGVQRESFGDSTEVLAI